MIFQENKSSKFKPPTTQKRHFSSPTLFEPFFSARSPCGSNNCYRKYFWSHDNMYALNRGKGCSKKIYRMFKGKVICPFPCGQYFLFCCFRLFESSQTALKVFEFKIIFENIFYFVTPCKDISFFLPFWNFWVLKKNYPSSLFSKFYLAPPWMTPIINVSDIFFERPLIALPSTKFPTTTIAGCKDVSTYKEFIKTNNIFFLKPSFIYCSPIS